MLKAILLVVVYLALGLKIEASQDVIKSMILNYRDAFRECKKEKYLPDEVDVYFQRFWRADHEVSSRATGCAILCVHNKLDLLLPDGSNRHHHGHLQDFSRKHGADDVMVHKLSEIINICEERIPHDEEGCLKILGIVNCFKAEIHNLNWAPNMEGFELPRRPRA